MPYIYQPNIMQFVIVRADGTRDLVEGVSREDISYRFGEPGNGDILPYTPGEGYDRQFDTVEEHHAVLNGEKKYAGKSEKAKKADADDKGTP